LPLCDPRPVRRAGFFVNRKGEVLSSMDADSGSDI
jgi:hypothetical protein